VETVLTVTDAAVEKALLVRAREHDPDSFALWVEVVAGEYDLSLQPVADAPAGAHVCDLGRITLVIPAESIDALRGSTLDRRGDLLTGGLVIDSPRPLSPPLG
jgi:Fe-S cluster assembly iron-binding protein IscA